MHDDQDSEAERAGLQVAFDQGRNGRAPHWIHNLGPAFEARMRREYKRGKAEKVRTASAAIKARTK